MSAIQQHITWNEFLPRVLGWNAINLYELGLQSDGYYERYDDRCNPTILNEFATAAFRFGHSLLKPSFKRMDDRYVNRVSYALCSRNFQNVKLRLDFVEI